MLLLYFEEGPRPSHRMLNIARLLHFRHHNLVDLVAQRGPVLVNQSVLIVLRGCVPGVLSHLLGLCVAVSGRLDHHI